VLFDETDHFAGFNFMDTKTKELIIQTPMNAGKLRAADNNIVFINSNKHTRIVGFRTTKRCHGSMKIKSI